MTLTRHLEAPSPFGRLIRAVTPGPERHTAHLAGAPWHPVTFHTRTGNTEREVEQPVCVKLRLTFRGCAFS